MFERKRVLTSNIKIVLVIVPCLLALAYMQVLNSKLIQAAKYSSLTSFEGHCSYR